MINDILSVVYNNSLVSDNEIYKNIINDLTNEIIKLKNDVNNYKAFHDAILENEAIKYKFNEYEAKINDLQDELYRLKQ